ncbi:hypothetical protein [Thermococcus sp. Bubb.Bath]|uniref:hypothetical protein n=1 Tax=Thermococcus sp. Bubb.Bath TaxID=1638242 RepID=UPI00143B315A|nr:hypothetical protein [Thermococcus sp. Bubb.Bath]NJF25582.1 hypothetical protein [Thermococcus sp. Bubb.Bath]
MSGKVIPKRLWRSLLLFFLLQLGTALVLFREGVASSKVLGLLVSPLVLILFFLAYSVDDPKFAGFFFYWLGFLIAASVHTPVIVRVIIFILLPLSWLLVYLDLRGVSWMSLSEEIYSNHRVGYILLLGMIFAGVIWTNYRLLRLSGTSWLSISIISLGGGVFVALYLLALKTKNRSTKIVIIKLTPWIYIFPYVKLTYGVVAPWRGLLLPIISAVLWMLLMGLLLQPTLNSSEHGGGHIVFQSHG